MEILEKAQKILEKNVLPDRQSFFQIEKFIIGKEPTAQSQIWAILRELQAKKETVEQIEKDLKDAEDNLELIELRVERLNREIKEESDKNEKFTDLNIQEKEINIRKLQRERESLINSARKVNKRLKCILEEIEFFIQGYEKITAKIEPKSIDDQEAQREMWNEKLLEEFNLRVIFNRPLDLEFVKTVLSLHDGSTVKKHVVNLIENIQKKMTPKPEVEVKAKIQGNK